MRSSSAGPNLVTQESPSAYQRYHISTRLAPDLEKWPSRFKVHVRKTGLIPVKGAGYRGKFGGEGWDGMWTDMSEIVRPTRDGIHGREFISTVVDIGYTPNFLLFDENDKPYGAEPHSFSIPLPILFDASPNHSAEKLAGILALAADQIGSLAVLPFDEVLKLADFGESVAPVLLPG